MKSIKPKKVQKVPTNLKAITNVSLQSWSLPFQTPTGIEDTFLTPKQTIKVPASYITDHVIRYQQRNLITIKNA